MKQIWIQIVVVWIILCSQSGGTHLPDYRHNSETCQTLVHGVNQTSLFLEEISALVYSGIMLKNNYAAVQYFILILCCRECYLTL